jgi:hypothetical protein
MKKMTTQPVKASDVREGMTILAGGSNFQNPAKVTRVEKTGPKSLRIYFGTTYHAVDADKQFDQVIVSEQQS